MLGSGYIPAYPLNLGEYVLDFSVKLDVQKTSKGMMFS